MRGKSSGTSEDSFRGTRNGRRGYGVAALILTPVLAFGMTFTDLGGVLSAQAVDDAISTVPVPQEALQGTQEALTRSVDETITDEPAGEAPTTPAAPETPVEEPTTPPTPPTEPPGEPEPDPSVEPSPEEEEGTGTSNDEEESAAIAPLSVPAPSSTTAVITVKVGGDRTTLTSVAPLAGTTLQLYNGGSGGPNASPRPEAWATCVSDADGDCSFTIPETQNRSGNTPAGVNNNARFWIKQSGVPTGYFMNTTLATGDAPSSTAYQFRTGSSLQANNVYTSTGDFMIASGSSNNEASGGIWQQSRTNPVFPDKCGIKVAMIVDLSGSVSPYITQLRSAAKGFVDALTGTPSEMALFTFASGAPAGTGANLPITGVATAEGGTAVKDRIDTYTASGATNWDRGIYQAAADSTKFDVAIVLTDGNPTYYAGGEGPGNWTRFREVENGIFSANALKAKGTKVVAFGVGSGVGGSPDNLRAISGPVAGVDYYQSADYAAAGAALRQLALGTCAGSVSVVKQVVPASNQGENIDGAVAAANWQFTASTESAGVGPATQDGSTDGTGAVNFPLTFSPGTSSGTITVAETQQDGYSIVTQAGKRAVCKDIASGAAVAVTNDPDAADAFSISAPASAAITCTVYNRPPQPQASITVDKTWVINDVSYPDGEQPIGIEAQLRLGASDQAWGAPRTGLQVGSSLEISEIPKFVGRDLCKLDSQKITTQNGALVTLPLPYTATIAATNTYMVTNVVTCTSELTLVKQVQGGTADPTNWNLDAVAPDGALPGPNGATGSAGATAPVTPEVSYPLAESGGSPLYVQSVGLNGAPQPPATGSWNCVQVNSGGHVVPGFADGINGAVIVPLGFKVRCTAVNQTASLTLVKEVVNDNGGSRAPDDWELTATPTGDFPAGLVPQTVTGSDDGETISVRPGTSYALSESSIAGYTLSSLQCNTGSGGSFVDTSSVTVPALGHVTCIFVNDDQAAQLTLIKIVENGTTGASTTASAWTLTAQGPDTVTGPGNSPAVTNQLVDSGEYALSESSTPGGYTASDWSCTGATTSDGSSVTLSPGDIASCTITNTAVAPLLTLQKDVENLHGGSRSATEFPLTATGPTTVSGISGTPEVSTVPVPVGDYTLSETNPDPIGYALDALACTNNGDPLDTDLTDPNATLELGDNVVCTFTNTDKPAKLTLIKDVAAGGTGSTKDPADWTLTAEPNGIDGQDTVSGNGSGVAEDGGVQEVTVFSGDYTLAEDGPTGFDAGDWVCLGGVVTDDVVTVPSGGNVICTITNTAISPKLTLVKVVENGTTGGESTTDDWSLTANGPTPITGYTGDESVTDADVQIGSYELSEVGTVTGYTASDWTCDGGQQDGPVVTLSEGDHVTCTITNTAIESSWTISKSSTPASGSTVLPGDLVEYTLTATHTGGVEPVNVVITDDLSDVLDDAVLQGTPVATVGSAALDGDTLTWTMDRFSSTATATYTVKVNADAFNATLHNVVTPPPGASCEGECETTHFTPGWKLTKSSDPASGSVVNPTSTVTYTLHALNTSKATVSGATAVDDLSDVLDDASLVQPLAEGLSYDPETQQLRWNIPTMAAGDPEVTVSYSVTVHPEAFGRVIANVVTPGTPGGECPITVPDVFERVSHAVELVTDDCDTTHRVRDVDLAIEKSHDPIPEGAVDSGADDVISYRVTVTNVGIDAATDVTVTDTLPEGLSYVADTLVAPAGWTAAFVDGTLTASSPGPFGAGATAEFRFEALVGELARESGSVPFPAIKNTACVDAGEQDSNPSDNCSTDTTPVKSIAVSADAVCMADAPYASYSVTPFNVSADPRIALIWWTQDAFDDRDPSIDANDTAALLADGASQVDRIDLPVGWTNGAPITGTILWPGAAVDASGNPTAWPGWTKNANGSWVLNPEAPFYDLRGEAVMEIRINPSTASELVYPPATPICNPAPQNTTPPTPAPKSNNLVSTGSDSTQAITAGIMLLSLGIVLGLVALRRRTRLGREE